MMIGWASLIYGFFPQMEHGPFGARVTEFLSYGQDDDANTWIKMGHMVLTHA